MDKRTFSQHTHQQNGISATPSQWRVRGLRGAITVSHNSVAAIAEGVDELLDALETKNSLDPTEIVNVIFSATPDLDAIFPAALARRRPTWNEVPLLDVQQMQVIGSLELCIRVLIYLNTPLPQNALCHVYLRGAAQLRPDLVLLS